MIPRARNRTSDYLVEPVRWADLQTVLRLAWRTTQPLYPAPFFEAVARTQPEYFRVVRENTTGKVRGFVIAARPPGLKDRLLLLAVEPGLVGQGLRRRLLETVQAVLRDEGIRSLEVGVPVADESALEFYRREGFHVVGVDPAPSLNEPDRAILLKSL
ncbi:MAG: GNAT family N-acetyltransferase [Euryarchaeota archaeon]|nr:GNAT family N-acetyltransferase [Euryarchaeota archaeon]